MIAINWRRVVLYVDGRFDPGCPQTLETPGEPPSFEIENIWCDVFTERGNKIRGNLMEILEEKDFEEIEKLVLKEIRKSSY